ncbi:MAG: 2-oxo-4-hydroxy-4-carboxy-5-ureidoimidazoline decarboxylase [Verrucomicrobiota bacterium]
MLNLLELNSLNQEEFTRLIGPVFEHSPWVAEKTWPGRPFATREQLHSALCQTVANADEPTQLKLIRAHPDLAGRMALTDASRSEQAEAQLNDITNAEAVLFQESNRQYQEKFGFPFVICARLNKKEAILHAFPIRLRNSPAEEKETALNEIYKIADLRLRGIIK